MDEMLGRKEKLAEGLLKLQQKYQVHLVDEFMELNERVSQLGKSGYDKIVLEDLQFRLHRIAGSGGSFGLKVLSEGARKLETKTCDWLQRRSDFGVKEQVRLFEGVAELPGLATHIELPATGLERPSGSYSQKKMEGERDLVIWLVEDDKILGREIVNVLSQFGYEARHFVRFEQAEQAANGKIPDLLIMDLLFSEEKVDATCALEGSRLLAMNRPILFISNYSDFHSRLRTVRLGGTGFMAKPLDLSRLVEHLERIFEQQSPQPFKVLIVDDDVMLSEHYSLVLESSGVDVRVIQDPINVIDTLSEFRPELVLMDVYMPDYGGIEVASLIRQYDEWVGLPIVYLSTETDSGQQFRAMRSGADDFLTKPISDHDLQMAVKVRASRARQLNEVISRDSLTGLLKHSCIKEELEVELSRARRNGGSLCVVMADIDHFKRVNDTYGHSVGDFVLKGVSHLFKQRFRTSDIIGRYGGEEFAIILPGCHADMAVAVMNDIRERFEAMFFHAGEERFSVTLSAGVACLADCPKPEELLIAADEALYQAKDSGRNRVCTYSHRT